MIPSPLSIGSILTTDRPVDANPLEALGKRHRERSPTEEAATKVAACTLPPHEVERDMSPMLALAKAFRWQLLHALLNPAFPLPNPEEHPNPAGLVPTVVRLLTVPNYKIPFAADKILTTKAQIYLSRDLNDIENDPKIAAALIYLGSSTATLPLFLILNTLENFYLQLKELPPTERNKSRFDFLHLQIIKTLTTLLSGGKIFPLSDVEKLITGERITHPANIAELFALFSILSEKKEMIPARVTFRVNKLLKQLVSDESCDQAVLDRLEILLQNQQLDVKLLEREALKKLDHLETFPNFCKQFELRI